MSQAEEKFQEKYRLKAAGYDFEKLVEHVSEIMDISSEELVSPGKDRKRSQARSLLCYWAVDRLGVSQTELGKRLKLTQPAISQAVRRGRALAKLQAYFLLND